MTSRFSFACLSRAYGRSLRGGMGVLVAVVIFALIVAGGGAMDFTQAWRMKAQLQGAADSAALTAAKSYLQNFDAAAAKNKAAKRVEAEMNGAALTLAPTVVTVVSDAGTGAVTADVAASGVVQSRFLGLIGMGEMPVAVAASAVVEPSIDVYLVLLIDGTGSMQPVIDAVKAAASSLKNDILNGLASRGLSAKKVYVKVAYFRDFRYSEAVPVWNESPLYDLSSTADQNAFEAFVGSETAPLNSGYDAPESSLAALAYAVTEPLPAALAGGDILQTIVLWTDASANPLLKTDVSWSVPDDDITVRLVKAQGPLNNVPADTGDVAMATPNYAEVDYQNPWPVDNYGCCKSFSEFKTKWYSGGAVPLSNRKLGLYVYEDGYPWPAVRTWPNVLTAPYDAPTASSVVDDILKAALAGKLPLRRKR